METARLPFVPILVAALPVGLWLTFGDASAARTVTVLTGCALLGWASARLISGRDRPAGRSPAPAPGPYDCQVERPAPARTTRVSRNVRCQARTPASGRRLARRR